MKNLISCMSPLEAELIFSSKAKKLQLYIFFLFLQSSMLLYFSFYLLWQKRLLSFPLTNYANPFARQVGLNQIHVRRFYFTEKFEFEYYNFRKK